MIKVGIHEQCYKFQETQMPPPSCSTVKAFGRCVEELPKNQSPSPKYDLPPNEFPQPLAEYYLPPTEYDTRPTHQIAEWDIEPSNTGNNLPPIHRHEREISGASQNPKAGQPAKPSVSKGSSLFSTKETLEVHTADTGRAYPMMLIDDHWTTPCTDSGQSPNNNDFSSSCISREPSLKSPQPINCQIMNEAVASQWFKLNHTVQSTSHKPDNKRAYEQLIQEVKGLIDQHRIDHTRIEQLYSACPFIEKMKPAILLHFLEETGLLFYAHSHLIPEDHIKLLEVLSSAIKSFPPKECDQLKRLLLIGRRREHFETSYLTEFLCGSIFQIASNLSQKTQEQQQIIRIGYAIINLLTFAIDRTKYTGKSKWFYELELPRHSFWRFSLIRHKTRDFGVQLLSPLKYMKNFSQKREYLQVIHPLLNHYQEQFLNALKHHGSVEDSRKAENIHRSISDILQREQKTDGLKTAILSTEQTHCLDYVDPEDIETARATIQQHQAFRESSRRENNQKTQEAGARALADSIFPTPLENTLTANSLWDSHSAAKNIRMMSVMTTPYTHNSSDEETGSFTSNVVIV